MKDKFSSSISYLDKFNEFNYEGRSLIKNKYNKIQGIYLWINNINNKSYVGKSVNLYQRLSQYLSLSYLNDNKTKMAICGALLKNSFHNFTFYILEASNKEDPSLKISNKDLDTNKPLNVTIDNINYKMLLKSNKK